MRQRVIKKLKQIGSDGSVSHSSFILNSDSEVSFYDNGKWRFFRFNGQTKWVEQTGSTENNQELLKYMLDAYRVLLTRQSRYGHLCAVWKRQ